ncbi:hypothetical protein BVY03_04200 [bacterium K02(2017)]|nr:hypothetical protein BVY03_04200 [bacterium K02(2017)]
MAENEEEVEVVEEPPKASKLMGILIPVLVSAVTAAIVGVIFTFVLAPKPEHKPDEVDNALKDATEKIEHSTQDMLMAGQTGIYHNYDPFIVSIFDREKVHYLKVVLSLELANEGVKEEISVRNPQVRDAMIFVLSDFTLRELLDNQSKNLLKEVLVKTLNKILGKAKVLNIYFTEFTIQ